MIRAFFNHLAEMGHIETSPCRIKIANPPRSGRKDIPAGDIEKMVRHAGRNARDRAIVLLLRDSGCRVGELVSMRVGGVKLEKVEEGGKRRLVGRALVYGEKMDKTRWIVFGTEAAKALRAYLAARPEVPFDEVFVSYDYRPLTRSGVYQMLKRVAGEAGVKRFNPHAFRHALAKRLMLARVPDNIIQEVLGHEDPATFKRVYVQLDGQELLHEYARIMYTRGSDSDGLEQSPRPARPR
jgi:integrase/recombinase XerD